MLKAEEHVQAALCILSEHLHRIDELKRAAKNTPNAAQLLRPRKKTLLTLRQQHAAIDRSPDDQRS
jgi:hypothetical protein